MKKLAIIALSLIAIQTTTAQVRNDCPYNKQQGNRMERFSDMTPDEMATLQTKRMTLHLDLNAAQQREVQKINLEDAKERKAIMEARKVQRDSGNMQRLSKDERLKIANSRLDRQIERKAEMKKILNDEQYAKWEEYREDMINRHKTSKPRAQKPGQGQGLGQGLGQGQGQK